MSETSRLLAGKRAITPLWIVALFVSLTETVLGIAVTQTQGNIQVALTVFVIAFPLLIAGSFFGILWHKPYVFYPPTDFSEQTKVGEYVEAMQRRPQLKQLSGAGGTLTVISGAPNPIEAVEEKSDKSAVDGFIDEIVGYFIDTVSISGLMILYAFVIAHSKQKAFDFNELSTKLVNADKPYLHGFIVGVSSCGFVEYTDTNGIWNVTNIENSLRERVPLEIDRRYKRYIEEASDWSMKVAERIMANKKAMEEYFN